MLIKIKILGRDKKNKYFGLVFNMIKFYNIIKQVILYGINMIVKIYEMNDTIKILINILDFLCVTDTRKKYLKVITEECWSKMTQSGYKIALNSTKLKNSYAQKFIFMLSFKKRNFILIFY